MNFDSIFGFASKLTNGITGAMTADVLRERISLINDQLDILRAAHEVTEKELSDAKTEIQTLKNELARYKASEEYAIEGGAAFKKDASGRYGETPFCPRCHNPIGAGLENFPFQCIPCKHITSLKQKDLKMAVAKLNNGL